MSNQELIDQCREADFPADLSEHLDRYVDAAAALRPLVDIPLSAGLGEARVQISGSAAAPEGELTLALRQAKLADLADAPPLGCAATVEAPLRSSACKTFVD